jgi:diguanylate cyclase (GGDEF)-like protein
MNERILVVDDEDTVRMVLSQVLVEDGHDVTEASCGEQALETFRREPYPVVLTDIYMGKMTGIDLLQEIKLIEPDTLVVIMTSNASLDTATSALRSGAYDYLTKPFDDIDLISAVVGRAIDKYRLSRDNRTLMDQLKRNAEELEELNNRLREMANRDGLTELFNHRYFLEGLRIELSRASRYQRSLSLIFIDIDHFKQYNDTHGHLAGDELLRTLARILRQNSRESTLVARYGGEEFVLVVPETDSSGARGFAENLRRAVEEHRFPGGGTQPLGKVTLSAGVATYPEDGADGPALINHADRALYEAKNRGRNTVRCWHEVEDSAEAVGSGVTVGES